MMDDEWQGLIDRQIDGSIDQGCGHLPLASRKLGLWATGPTGYAKFEGPSKLLLAIEAPLQITGSGF
jgi:hypothetical protein